MRLLIVTQKVHKHDPVLGFFHEWIIAFSKECEQVNVICLEKGQSSLPANVNVVSLGKEEGRSKITYVYRFFKYILGLWSEYDVVFVHMNQEYILMGGLLWRLLGKKTFLWRNHAKGNFLTRIAVFLSHKVLCTSPKSFTATFKKTKIMPAGVDTEFFKPDANVKKMSKSILFLGRIAPVKKVDVFIDALIELNKRGVEFRATIAGSPDPLVYENSMQERVVSGGVEEDVAFVGSVNREEALHLYQSHEVYVNVTPSGSLDKTIFEALSAGSKVLVTNTFFIDKLPDGWVVREGEVAEALAAILSSKGEFDSSFVQQYSLTETIRSLVKEFK